MFKEGDRLKIIRGENTTWYLKTGVVVTFLSYDTSFQTFKPCINIQYDNGHKESGWYASRFELANTDNTQKLYK